MKSSIDRRRLLAGVTALALTSVAAPVAWAQASPRPTPAQFAKTPRVEEISLSPDAKRIAYVTQEGAERILVIIDLASGSAQKFPMGAYKLRDMFWAGPQHIVFETSVTTPVKIAWRLSEYFQAHVFNIETGKAITLFDTAGYHDIVLGGFQVFRRDGKYSLSASNISPTTDSVTLFEFDLTSPSGDFLDGGREGTTDWVVSPTGRLLGRESFDVTNNSRGDWLLEMFVDKRWKEVVRRAVITETPSLVGIGRDEDHLVIYLNEEGEGGTYHEIDASGTIGPALFGGDGNRYPLFHPLTRRLCGYGVTGDWPERHYDDQVLAGVTGALADMIEPGERVKSVSFAEDPRKMILYTEGRGNAGSYFYTDFTTGDVVPILQNYPDVGAEWISDKKAISFKAADGKTIPAFVTYPPFREPKDLPLVVLVHGGPQARDTLAFDWEAQAYASQGYAVLQVNYRGSSGYGWNYMASGFGEYGRKMQTDLSDGVRHLVKLGIVDAKKVAIAGASYGGYAALMGATVDHGVYACAVDIAGVSDPKFFYLNTNLTENPRYRWAKRMLGDGNLDEISPLKNADKADIPILIIHGDDDTVVSIEESNRMNGALKRAGKDVTFVKLQNEDHWQSTEAGRTEMINTIVPFLKQYVPV
ncbi:hypothetical protein ABAC460_21815 [Asticcacaulis sp. AC460]|uniref:alpha/beta hydrolase family protein n=1 Tax=Asticcacaulis sp. AC460 TaxID=1282360 RepID=UPI0003C40B41|nr:alpha/beta fold hydrolase [Asticcacaulis sp. AC460]ESQ86857.1 hypothetical protein ABAC460_21815 [Asticcacaulis sp. AC460]